MKPAKPAPGTQGAKPDFISHSSCLQLSDGAPGLPPSALVRPARGGRKRAGTRRGLAAQRLLLAPGPNHPARAPPAAHSRKPAAWKRPPSPGMLGGGGARPRRSRDVRGGSALLPAAGLRGPKRLSWAFAWCSGGGKVWGPPLHRLGRNLSAAICQLRGLGRIYRCLGFRICKMGRIALL